MRILGLIGSSRKLGNTEVLVKEVVRAASVATDDVRLLRLTDLRLDYCTGCMGCALRDGGPCRLNDDMEFLLTEMQAADGLVLGAPAYALLPPGPVKLLVDRFIMALARQDQFAGQAAVTVGVAGLREWGRLLLPFLNSAVMAFGYRLAGALMAYAPGPGQVLLDPANLEHAIVAGANLRRALAGADVRPDFGPGHCPVCGADFFRPTVDGGLECPVCLAQGRWTNGAPVFDATPAHRWEPEALKHHFHDWIRATGPAYLAQRPQIKECQRPYRDLDRWWIRPPSRDVP
ncbi:MAG: NAD(P)H-dependent oxidoreductase [Chloroflexi bacterium]|nr:NAD(P)H-dependent oxidoreductase [Chloroflexota bacterium]MBU1747741.1 NAD(P)H-dependent oxidoreductase [Chloroflexota bacterium]MBU1878992.1 NAD(P)H-dependent oxidoreductase [Chloroflexota bacterium]